MMGAEPRYILISLVMISSFLSDVSPLKPKNQVSYKPFSSMVNNLGGIISLGEQRAGDAQSMNSSDCVFFCNFAISYFIPSLTLKSYKLPIILIHHLIEAQFVEFRCKLVCMH